MKLALVLVACWSSLAAADPAKAKQHNNEGMKLYGKKLYGAALEEFDKALKDDPNMVLAHYNAASMASLQGDIARVIKELEWLNGSKDPAAVKALAVGKTDTDLERASTHPRVRSIIGLPPIEKVEPAAVLLEKSGVWSMEGSACAGAMYQLAFKKGGSVTVKTQWACDANEHNGNEVGTWAIKDGKLTVKSKTIFKGGGTAAFVSCNHGDEGAICIDIDGADQTVELHRGPGTFL